jgi:alkylated DNA repair dioxygenase AlkB
MSAAAKRKITEGEESEEKRQKKSAFRYEIRTKDCAFRYFANYLSKEESKELFDYLMENADWKEERPIVFGKVQKTDRKTAFYGDKGTSYRYSGVDHESLPWLDKLSELRDRIQRDLNQEFSYVLVQYYPDGKAKLGLHADNEWDIHPESIIAGLSLGAERKVTVKDLGATSANSTKKVLLQDGSLMTMEGMFQKKYKHGILEDKEITKPRISLTFRLVKKRD